MRQERALLKTKTYQSSLEHRVYFGVAKTEFRFHAIGHL